MFTYLEQILTYLAGHLPLYLFAPLASIIEEAIPPIPSPSVMMITGFLSSVQNYSIYGIAGLVLIGSLGKTLGAWLVYIIMDKIEDIIMGRFGRFIGVTHEEVEAFGKRLSGGKKDYFLLIFLRALPIIPSTLLSVGGGLLKISLKLFLISTFLGSFIRNSLYIYLGYISTAVALSIIKKTSSIESIIQILVGLVIVFIFGFIYFRRRAKK